MNIAEVVFMAIVLAMDALAVSVCKGMTIKKLTVEHTLKCRHHRGDYICNNGCRGCHRQSFRQ